MKQQFTNIKSSTFDADVIFLIKTSIFGTMVTRMNDSKDEKKMPLLCSYRNMRNAFSMITEENVNTILLCLTLEFRLYIL